MGLAADKKNLGGVLLATTTTRLELNNGGENERRMRVAGAQQGGSHGRLAQNHGARRARRSGLVFVAAIAGASRALLRHRYVARSPLRYEGRI
eukprot:scaffold8845_cov120-Isochrysis_galbana.AAC.4